MVIDRELKYLVTTGFACLLAGFALGKNTQESRSNTNPLPPEPKPDFDAPRHYGSGCFDDRTEVMIPGGFSFWKDIDLDSEIAQYDMETGKISFSKPSSLVERLHVGKMLSFRSETVDICVTPDHDLIGMRKLNDPKAVPKYEKIKAADITEMMPFPTAARNDEVSSLNFVGSAPDKLDAGGLVGVELPETAPAFAKFDLTTVCVADAYRLVKRLCRDYGVQAGGDCYGVITIPFRSYALSDKFMVLCTLAGVKVSRVPGAATVLVYCGSHVGGFPQTAFYPSPELVSYSGYVYCATMPKGTIVTRRNGRIAIAGNKSFG